MFNSNPPSAFFLRYIAPFLFFLPGLILSQKKHYRQRAHANPFSDHALQYPESPEAIDWDLHYPAFSASGRTPAFADVGCGFGGLLIALAPLFPDTLMLGECTSSHPEIMTRDLPAPTRRPIFAYQYVI